MTGLLTGTVQRRVEVTVVDTTGLISGELGRALKTAKIDAVMPDHIVAIQRGDELEHILSHIGDRKVYRLKISCAAKKRSASARAAFRKKKLEKYFREQDLLACMLDRSAVPFFYRGRMFRHGEREIPRGAIIGLNRNEYTIALGILDAAADTKALCRSPLRSLKGINRVVFGDMIMP
jgi:polynucleotide 5'-hydroxyl-kinase GRC3/NOL9